MSLLPGPVEVAVSVREALAESPISHRGRPFISRFERVRRALGELVGGRDVALFCGSGTLANDVVAATLSVDRTAGHGLILANGEFGDRLVRQARRAGLTFQTLQSEWGQPWDLDKVSSALEADPAVGWAWGVHLESSTGMLNDLPGLVGRLRGSGVRVCVDCVSGLGATPLDLTGVHLASGSSGKSLGAFAGLAVVFAAPGACDHLESGRLFSYLDLKAALSADGPLFTVPSPLLAALDQALHVYASPQRRWRRFDEYAELGRRVRRGLTSLGFHPVVAESWASPVLATFEPPQGWSAEGVHALCRSLGFEVAIASPYLARRGWLQVATMGAVTLEDCDALLEGLSRHLGRWQDCQPARS